VARGQAPAPRLVISVNGAGQLTTHHFQKSAIVPFNQEDGSIASTYVVGSGPAIDIGARVRVWRQLSAGVAVSSFSNKSDALVAALIPHPFFFNQLRSVSGTAPGTTRGETGVHIDLAWLIPLGTRLRLNVFGGPSVIQVSQDLVSDITYSETYPYDTATFTSAPLTRQSKSVIAVNGGFDVSMPITRMLGIGGLLRYSGARVNLTSSPNDSVSIAAGGLQVGGGIRLKF
jgi:hypothetical protein